MSPLQPPVLFRLSHRLAHYTYNPPCLLAVTGSTNVDTSTRRNPLLAYEVRARTITSTQACADRAQLTEPDRTPNACRLQVDLRAVQGTPSLTPLSVTLSTGTRPTRIRTLPRFDSSHCPSHFRPRFAHRRMPPTRQDSSSTSSSEAGSSTHPHSHTHGSSHGNHSSHAASERELRNAQRKVANPLQRGSACLCCR